MSCLAGVVLGLHALCGVVGEGTVLKTEYQLIAPVNMYTQDDVDFLAQNLYFEERARKSVYTGKAITDSDIAQIGYVVLNRVESKHFPDTIQGVIWQRKQFSWTHDGKSDVMNNYVAKIRAYRIAYGVLDGTIPNLVGDADHYLNRIISKATWWNAMKFKGRNGDHWFYKR